MAYIIGIVSDQEYNILNKRGWDIEEPPNELKSDVDIGFQNVMIWIDDSLFNIMDGPDWEKRTSHE